MTQEGEEPTRANSRETRPARRRRATRTIVLVLVALLVVAALAGAGYALLNHPGFTATLADISIIALAFTSVLIGLFLVVLVFQLQSLIALLRDEIKPILESANQTASTVRGTTAFLSDAVVNPIINVASYAAAVRQTVRVLSGSRKGRRRAPDQGGSSDGSS